MSNSTLPAAPLFGPLSTNRAPRIVFFWREVTAPSRVLSPWAASVGGHESSQRHVRQKAGDQADGNC
jgi:hypothetical protein